MEEYKYNPSEIENKWQEKWAADRLYEVRDDDPRPKWYELTMFPYTSGDLHIGHWYAMAPADAHARYRRLQGYNVLHPMGFDAFGLPAENAAIKHGVHPLKWTMENVEHMRRQLKSIGAIYDWNREIVTCVPEYYKWTQWFFLKLYQAGLAYRGKAPVVWCPGCQTTLANEQVVGEGVCERCSSPVTRKDLEQWFFRITKYADELLDFSQIQWPEKINTMQRNWIGRSEGVQISFGLSVRGVNEKEIRVFTTRPDTIYGVTFMVLAPEHPLVAKITTKEQKKDVEAYVEQARKQTEIERMSTEKEKTGVFTGTYAINKLNGDKIALYVADYVIASYGTGIVMGVPAHDTRDFAFAKKYGIPIKVVIAPPEWKGEELEDAFIEIGTMVNSQQFDGLPSDKGLEAIADFIQEKGYGKRTVTYRIRDWLISRQRYWGAPIPMMYCERCGEVPVPEKDLPVLLPADAEFRTTGESPLKYHQGFLNTKCPKCGSPARRETDTMDTFMCSSWYFLRYASPHTSTGPYDPAHIKQWLPVDQYTGGAEHAVMHLLYSRFFIRAIRDMGLVDFSEPFVRLYNQGTLTRGGRKISKRDNVVDADQYVRDLGADAVRTYLMFVGPWEEGGDWNDDGIIGASRWLNRVWNLVLHNYQEASSPDANAVKDLKRLTHKTIRKVTDDYERFRFNTMVAAMMEYTNYLSRVREAGSVDASSWREAVDALLLLLAPTTPHLAEELWGRTGHQYSIHNQRWPKWDEELAREDEITLIVQVNGKVRDKLVVPASVTEEQARTLVLNQERVKAHLEGKQVRKVIYVPGRLINLVAN